MSLDSFLRAFDHFVPLLVAHGVNLMFLCIVFQGIHHLALSLQSRFFVLCSKVSIILHCLCSLVLVIVGPSHSSGFSPDPDGENVPLLFCSVARGVWTQRG